MPSFPPSDMPLHVRRSSDPALLTINGPFGVGGEPRPQVEDPPSRKNPTRWSTTAGFLKARHASGTNSLERKVRKFLEKTSAGKQSGRRREQRLDSLQNRKIQTGVLKSIRVLAFKSGFGYRGG